ncbi:MAG: glycosyltransferase family 2 protein [Candidatus Kariarchaeaceae archaeon]|jgi:glycosyltransferase involved in cell wall biosynthesis
MGYNILETLNVCILIPALNEELSIKKTLNEIPLIGAEIIVINNGSTDKTALIAKNWGATIIHEPRKGYGYACLAGINYLKSKDSPPDLVIFLDADLSDYPSDILELLNVKFQSKTKPHLVLGNRFARLEKRAMSPHAIIANKIFTKLIWLLYKVKLNDMGPMRIIEYNTLISLDMNDHGARGRCRVQTKNRSVQNFRIFF